MGDARYITERQADVSQHILLDANEHYRQWVQVSPDILTKLNRYPDRTATEFKRLLTSDYCYPLAPDNVFACSGSIEAIDLLIHALNPGVIALNSPTYDVYAHRAQVHGAKTLLIPFRANGQPDVDKIIEQKDNIGMIVFISPNNPTGQLVSKESIQRVLNAFHGPVIIDEAYIEFAGLDKSHEDLVLLYDNVIILRTFSKAWGLAGARLGYVLAQPDVIKKLEAHQNPYSTSALALHGGICALQQKSGLDREVKDILENKQILIEKLTAMGYAVKDTAANFVIIDVENPDHVSEHLRTHGVVVRKRPYKHGGDDILRVTVGSSGDVEAFTTAISSYWERGDSV